ncbi:hypothetical protein AVEN_235469-1 [Araneus ventricosus]|uniref:Uncharacterized protein n=1 Tax=Araneus ventricosus TaxID=182803 RepID=A0A4Y2A5M9_ARAVE|nr:hypothetical protein AVEN_235469-1 [Araneus ventricosus]
MYKGASACTEGRPRQSLGIIPLEGIKVALELVIGIEVLEGNFQGKNVCIYQPILSDILLLLRVRGLCPLLAKARKAPGGLQRYAKPARFARYNEDAVCPSTVVVKYLYMYYTPYSLCSSASKNHVVILSGSLSDPG